MPCPIFPVAVPLRLESKRVSMLQDELTCLPEAHIYALYAAAHNQVQYIHALAQRQADEYIGSASVYVRTHGSEAAQKSPYQKSP